MPFFAKADRVRSERPVDRKNSVEMVDFVLQEFGPIGLELDLVALPLLVVVPNPDPISSLNSHQQIREGETVVPYGEVVGSNIDDLWIDQNPGSFHLNVNDSDRRSDLGSGDAPTRSETTLPISKGLPQVVDDDPDRGRLVVFDRRAAGPEHGVAQKSDSVDGHGVAEIWELL